MNFFEIDGKIYFKVTPIKRLFNSTTVHEVVNRGDVFAVRTEDMMLTILSGKLVDAAEKQACCIMPVSLKPALAEDVIRKPKKLDTATERKRLKEIRDDIQKGVQLCIDAAFKQNV